jgi:hypothetical protein
MAEAVSRLARRIAAGEFVVTAEVTPPLAADREALLALVRPLTGLADAINVTDGANARAHMSALVAAALMVEVGVEPVLQLTCRDRNRIALQGDLLGAATLGIRNILALAGDDPKAGDQPDAKPVYDLSSRDLIATAALMRDTGALPSGRAIAGAVPLFIGAADAPIDPPSGWRRRGRRARSCHADRHRAARLGGLGALDAPASLRHDHRRRHRDADGAGARSPRRGHPHRHRADRRAPDYSRGGGRPYHGAAQRRGDSGGDRRGRARLGG